MKKTWCPAWVVIWMLISTTGCMNQEEIQVESVDFAAVKDGGHEGCHELPPFLKACVVVKVKEATVTEIKIVEHECGKGHKAEQPIIERVIETQSLEVDAVSGATLSSRTILKAIEEALRKGM